MKPNGGPAFPHRVGRDMGDTEGMSLRDYFAAAALNGYLTGHIQYPTADSPEHAMRMCAADAYDMADVMLAERDK